MKRVRVCVWVLSDVRVCAIDWGQERRNKEGAAARTHIGYRLLLFPKKIWGPPKRDDDDDDEPSSSCLDSRLETLEREGRASVVVR